MLIGFGRRFGNIEDDKSIHDIINCNILSMARMCHMVLPQMIKRQNGVIVNIGSLSSAMPTPLLTIYGATKVTNSVLVFIKLQFLFEIIKKKMFLPKINSQAFVEKFSRDLAAEVKSLGVTVQTVHPGYVATNMASFMKPSLLSPDPNTYAAATLRTLGLEQRTAGYWTHKIQVYSLLLSLNVIVYVHLCKLITIN